MSLKAILHYEHLLAAYREGEEGIPTPLTDLLYVNPEVIPSDDAKLFVDPVEKRPSPLNRRGASARVMQLTDAKEQRGALFSLNSVKELPEDLLFALREQASHAIDRMGKREAERQVRHFAEQNAITKELALAKFLTTGSVIADSEGNIRDTAGTGDVTYDFGIAAGHKNQLDYNGGGAIIGTEWDEAGADILTDLEEIDRAAREQNAPPPDVVVVNSTFKEKIRNNTDFQTWAAASPMNSERILAGQEIPNLWGKRWLFLDHTYEDPVDGTTKKFIPDAKAALFPSNVSSWLRPVMGEKLVPTSLDVMPGWQQALNSMTTVAGRWVYAKVDFDPISLKIYMGDTFGWICANANALWAATIWT